MPTKTNEFITRLEDCESTGWADLSPRAKQLYKDKCRELIETGGLRRIYLPTLISWAHHYARGLKLAKEVETEGDTFKIYNRNGDGVICANPKVKMMNDAFKMADKLLLGFGSTVEKARRLGKQEPKKKSALEEFKEKYGRK
jgi:phage terminase small subunit